MSEESEYWQQYRDHKREQKEFHQRSTTPTDIEMLQTLPVRFSVEKDGAGGDRYVIDIVTDRGVRTVDWWVATGLWKVRKGRGEGRGIYRLARYFQLVPRRDGSV